MIDDQYTFELVREIARRNIKDPGDYEFYGVDSLRLTGGDFRVNTDSIEILPNKFEEKFRTFVNNTSSPKQYRQTTRLETTKSIVLEVEKTVNTSEEYRFTFGISNAIAKLNADLVQKSSFSLTTKESQKVEEKQIVEYPEEYNIPANTVLTVKYLFTKGIAKAALIGQAIIDGTVNIRARMSTGVTFPPYYIVSGLFKLTDSSLFNIEPQRRLTPFQGYLMAESYDSLELTYSEKPLSSFGIDLDTKPITHKHNGLLVFDGAYGDSETSD